MRQFSRIAAFSHFLCSILGLIAASDKNCQDGDNKCTQKIAYNNNNECSHEIWSKICRKSCGQCDSIEERFDIRHLRGELKPLYFLIGKWRSEIGGKVTFPTIPVFTYGEQIEISILESGTKKGQGRAVLNYTSYAWDFNNQQELHSEYGFIAYDNETNQVALSAVMSNGFVTVEQGELKNEAIRFKLKDVGRISFTPDLAVQGVSRLWRKLSNNHLQHRLSMETITHKLHQHTSDK